MSGSLKVPILQHGPSEAPGESTSGNRESPTIVDLPSVVLSLRDLEKSYPIGDGNFVQTLRGISLCDANRDGSFGPVCRGEFLMIRGPSGGGKTTLLNMIGTIDTPTSGTIELMGSRISNDTSDAELADLRLRKIGFVFQTFNLIATMTAAENVELPMALLGELSAEKRRLRSVQLLALVGLRNRVHHLPSELSGGEQQRVTIARSLANNPELLLLDEPTGDLDTLNTIEVMDLLLQLNRMTKTTCIMVTHNPDLECYADRILYVSDGCFVKEVRNTRPQRLLYASYLEHLERREKELTTVVDSSSGYCR
ncbi:putative ABC transporter [Trypanosoma vivax]|uniref:Putative ABC transporter n=1 Tax=Trypanosoma vivax (strain Y486) TaxID=1055687 RepID=G0TT92_TRYVY|nr:putative ABC transporter [Trypanosoma vivax]KAH8605811.1 putative ABC transporter [Trypanosoma vivax]CCC47173.1 putative ABC transporter [Trypanosoma vivax Y486]